MPKEKELVAILYDNNGLCKELLVLENVDIDKKNRLINQMLQHQSLEAQEKKNLLDRISKLEKYSSILKLDIMLDRGEITQEQYDEEISKYGE